MLLTAAGEEFLPRVMRLLADFDGAIGDVVRFGALERGRVGVAAAPSAITQIIAPAAAAFAARHPAVRLYLSDDNSGRIQRKVAAREVDFGLTSRWADAPGLDFEPLLEDRFGVLYREDDAGLRPGRDGTVRWADLAGRQLVGVVDETGIIALLRARADLPIEAAAPFHEASAPPRRRRWSRRDWAWRCCRRWPPSACASRDWPRAAGPAHHGAHGLPDPPPGLSLESGGRCADRRDPRLFENGRAAARLRARPRRAQARGQDLGT